MERHGTGAVPAGVEVHHLHFHEVTAVDGAAPHEMAFQKMMTEKPEDEDMAVAARRFMTEEYQPVPTLGGAQRAVQQVISLLADERPVITHCFAGKDRTGFTVATVLNAIGVDRDVVLADFLRSDEAVPRLREQILKSVRERTRDGRGAHIRRGAIDRRGARRAAGYTLMPHAARSTSTMAD